MRRIRIAQIGINQYSHSLEILTSITKQTDLFEFVGLALPEREEERIPQKMEKIQDYPRNIKITLYRENNFPYTNFVLWEKNRA